MIKNFTFETSVGIVKCTVDFDKPLTSSDPGFPGYVISEGVVTILEGKEYLDKLYRWENLDFKDGWVQIELNDGYYGCPEYKVTY